MFSKWLHGICYCLLVVASATVASGQGLSVNSVPNTGIVQPLTPSSSGAAGAMPAACPAGQALTHITSDTYTCQPFEGGSGNIPAGTVNQLLGWDNNNNPEAQTIGGGSGNCIYTRTNLQYGSITCGNYVTLGGGQFTGTVGSPLFYMSSATGGLYSVAGSGVSAGGATVRPNSVAIPANGQYLIGDAPLNFSNLAGTATDAQIGPNYSGIGACTSGAFVTALQRNSTPICLTPAFAPLTNPAGGQNNYAPLAGPSFTGVVALNDAAGGMIGASGAGIALGGSVLRPNSINLPAGGQYLINDVPIGGGSAGAPLVNPAGGQNNYAPIDVPVFTGATFTLLAPSQGILFNSGGTTNTITSSITNQGVASNFLGMTAGVHYNGSTYILDATTPNGIVLNGQIGMYGGTGTIGSTWSPLSIGTFSNTGLSMGAGLSITTPNLTVSNNASVTNNLTAAKLGVGNNIPSDLSTGATLTNGTFSSGGTVANNQLDTGLYPSTAGGLMVTTNQGIYHVVENSAGHELGFFMGNNQPTGAIWSTQRTQYLALRDANVQGGVPGLILETGGIQAMNGGITAGGVINGTTGVDINSQPLTGVQAMVVSTFSNGGGATATISNAYGVCSYVRDAAGGAMMMGTCSFGFAWSGLHGQTNTPINVGYLPWALPGNATQSAYFNVGQMSGVNNTAGCQLAGTVQPGTSWLTIGQWGANSACGTGSWVTDSQFAASGNMTFQGSMRFNQ